MICKLCMAEYITHILVSLLKKVMLNAELCCPSGSGAPYRAPFWQRDGGTPSGTSSAAGGTPGGTSSAAGGTPSLTPTGNAVIINNYVSPFKQVMLPVQSSVRLFFK